jgi:hypothetical protein
LVYWPLGWSSSLPSLHLPLLRQVGRLLQATCAAGYQSTPLSSYPCANCGFEDGNLNSWTGTDTASASQNRRQAGGWAAHVIGTKTIAATLSRTFLNVPASAVLTVWAGYLDAETGQTIDPGAQTALQQHQQSLVLIAPRTLNCSTICAPVLLPAANFAAGFLP